MTQKTPEDTAKEYAEELSRNEHVYSIKQAKMQDLANRYLNLLEENQTLTAEREASAAKIGKLEEKIKSAKFYFKYLTEDKWANQQALKYAGDAKEDPQSVGDMCRLALLELEKEGLDEKNIRP